MQRHPTAARDRVPGRPSLCMPPPALAQPGPRRAILALTSVLVNQRVENLLAQAGDLFSFWSRSCSHFGSFQGADDINGIAHDAELKMEIAMLRVAALQGEETQLADGEAKVLQFLDVEPRAGGDRTRDQPGEHNQVAPGRELQLYAIAILQAVR